jgi:molybdopterin synthase sulfur carrier subunit
MTVLVRLPTILRPLADGQALVRAEGQTVGEVFADLEQRHPGIGDRLVDQRGLHQFVNVFVGDEDVRYLDGLDTPVPEGAEISILPAVAGG